MTVRTCVALLVLVLIGAGCARRAASTPSNSATQPMALPRGPHADAIERGVKFLVRSQQPEGCWGTGLETRGLEIYSMVPGSHDAFRVATTALCVMALREAYDLPVPGLREAHARGVQYLVRNGEARRDDGRLLYNVWAHTYALQALSVELRHHHDPRVEAMARWHLDRMIRYATYVGGWNYYDFKAQTQRPSLGPTSFGTAAGLVALWEARRAGLQVPQSLIDASLRRVMEMRLPIGVYLYSLDHRYIPRLPANQIKGAVGRTQPCNYALWLWGYQGIGEAQVRQGLDLFFEHHAFLDMARKRPWPHEAWYQNSAYYYYFDHYYAALLVERLSPAARSEYAARLAAHVAPYQEPDDGSWWDYAMWDYHKPYGTAFAVMTLLRCDAALGAQQPGNGGFDAHRPAECRTILGASTFPDS